MSSFDYVALTAGLVGGIVGGTLVSILLPVFNAWVNLVRLREEKAKVERLRSALEDIEAVTAPAAFDGTDTGVVIAWHLVREALALLPTEGEPVAKDSTPTTEPNREDEAFATGEMCGHHDADSELAHAASEMAKMGYDRRTLEVLTEHLFGGVEIPGR